MSGYGNKKRNNSRILMDKKYGHDYLMNTIEAAEYLGISPNSLAIMRHRDKHGIHGNPDVIPKVTRVGPKNIRYMKRDLDEYLEKCQKAYGNG